MRKKSNTNKYNGIRHLIITIHGIRTYGHWQERLEAIIKSENQNIKFAHYRYGYFSIVAFIVPLSRWLVTKRFRQELIHLVEVGNYDRIDIVAHSFGTHISMWGLHGIQEDERPKIHTVITCGSVLRPSFPWFSLWPKYVDRVVNDCGTKDLVLVLNQLAVLFTGMAGRVGFEGFNKENYRNRFFQFGHSGYFESRSQEEDQDSFMRERWVPLLTGDVEIIAFDERKPPTVIQGIGEWMLHNADPIKIGLYILISLLFAGWLFKQWNTAEAATTKATTHVYANAAYALCEVDPTIAYRFAKESLREEFNVTGALALLKSFNSGSWFYSHSKNDIYDAALSDNGKTLAWICHENKLHLLCLVTNVYETQPTFANNVEFSPDNRLIQWHANDGIQTLGSIYIHSLQNDRVDTINLSFDDLTISENGKIFVPAYTDIPGSLALHIINTQSGEVEAHPLPNEIIGRIVHFAFKDGTGYIVGSDESENVVVFKEADGFQVFNFPDGYRLVDIDATGKKLVVYLSGVKQDLKDCIGFIDFANSSSGQVIPTISFGYGEDYGEGKVKFHPDGSVVAAVADGSLKIIDLDKREIEDIVSYESPTDKISVSQDGEIIVIGRRSGHTSIYNYNLIPSGRLLGNHHSYGRGAVFSKISMDSSGNRVLTVSRSGMRLWIRPNFQLTLPHASYHAVGIDSIPIEYLNLFQRYHNEKFPSFWPCEELVRVKQNDEGIISLCVQYEDRIDFFSSGLKKGQIDIVSSGGIYNLVSSIIGRKADQYFILSPDVALGLLDEEDKKGHIWQLDSTTISTWINL